MTMPLAFGGIDLSLSIESEDLSVLMRQKIETVEELSKTLVDNRINLRLNLVFEKRTLLYGVNEFCGYIGENKSTVLASILTFDNIVFSIKKLDLFGNHVDLYDAFLEDSIRIKSGFSEVSFIRIFSFEQARFHVAEYSRKPPTNPLWDAVQKNDLTTIKNWLFSFDTEVVIIAYYTIKEFKLIKDEKVLNRINYLKKQNDVVVKYLYNDIALEQILTSIDLGETWR